MGASFSSTHDLDRDSVDKADLDDDVIVSAGSRLPDDTDVWIGFNVYKVWGVRTNTSEEILAAWEKGDVVVTRDGGNVPDYNTVVGLL